MQAYAKVFDILRNAGSEALPEADRFRHDIADIAEALRRSSAITSRLLDLAACALANDPGRDACSGFVEDSRGGKRTEQAAIDEAVAVDVLAALLFARLRSRHFAEKILSATRQGSGRPKALQP
jgi:6-phosphogluconate dehydrogenase